MTNTSPFVTWCKHIPTLWRPVRRCRGGAVQTQTIWGSHNGQLVSFYGCTSLLNTQNEISEKDHNEVNCTQNFCISWAFINSSITLLNFTSPENYISCTSAYLECMVRESKALPAWWSSLLTLTARLIEHSNQSITRNRVDFISPTNYNPRSLIWTSWKPHCWRNLPTSSKHCWRSPTGRLADAIGEALHARRSWGFTLVMASER